MAQPLAMQIQLGSFDAEGVLHFDCLPSFPSFAPHHLAVSSATGMGAPCVQLLGLRGGHGGALENVSGSQCARDPR